jgi:hypothetical protein
MRVSRAYLAAAVLAVTAAAVPASAVEPFSLDTPGLRFVPGASLAGDGIVGGAVRAAAEAPPRADTRGQFMDAAGRNQAGIGSCHTFGSIGVLEAAYYRQHGRRVRLSEQDLFIQRQVLSGDVYEGFVRTGDGTLTEGGHPSVNLRHALDHGVLTGDGYAGFVRRWNRYREAERRTLDGLERERRRNGWLVNLFYDPRAHWRELQNAPETRRIINRYLQGRDDASDAERARVRRELAGMTLRTRDFEYRGEEGTKLSAARCLAAGAPAARAIRGELDAGRPVVLSMTLKGLAAWGTAGSTDHANHAFVVTGYSVRGGRAVLHTRNSWGGMNPDVREDELCRVYSVSSVLARGERGTF